jgi:hypothetical protein
MRLEDILANKFIRITLMIFFLLFVYQILYAIGVFFAIEKHILSIYLCWITMVVIFASILPFKKYQFTVSKERTDADAQKLIQL